MSMKTAHFGRRYFPKECFYCQKRRKTAESHSPKLPERHGAECITLENPSVSAENRSRPKRHTERSEEHTSELQSLMRISYAVFCLKKKNKKTTPTQQQYLTDMFSKNISNLHKQPNTKHHKIC